MPYILGMSGRLKVLALGHGRNLPDRGAGLDRFRGYAKVCEMTYAVAAPRPEYGPLSEENLRVVPVRSSSFMRFQRFSSAGGEILRRARERGSPFDLIVTQDPLLDGLSGLHLSRRHGIPVCVHHHSDFFGRLSLPGATVGDRARAKMAVFVSRRASGIRALTETMAGRIAGHGVPRDRIFSAIPPASPLAEPAFEEIERVEAETGMGSLPSVLFVGRLTSEKQVPALVRIFRDRIIPKVPGARLVIVGDGPDMGEARREAVEIPDSVLFTGARERASLPPYYRLADILLLPSRYEGVPKVLIEAARAGLPAVAFGVGGIPDIISDGVTGRIVPPGDWDSFAATAAGLLLDETLRKSLSKASMARAEKEFDYLAGIERVIEIWRAVASGTGVRRAV